MTADGGRDADVPDPETAVEEGVLLAVGEGDPETVRETLGDRPHRRGTWARVELLLPTAMLERILLEVEDSTHATIADWVRTMVWVRMNEIDLDLEKKVQVDVPVDDDAWERGRLAATAQWQLGKTPESAFWDTMNEAVPTAFNYVRAGSAPSEEPLSPEDLPIEHDGEGDHEDGDEE